MMKKLIIGSLLLAAGACGRQDQENQEFTDSPVLEGYLQPGSTFQLSVSRQIPFIDDATFSTDNINELSISVRSDGEEVLLNPHGEGEYSSSSITSEAGRTYSLSFMFDGRLVEATTYIPEKPIAFESSATSIAITRIDTASGPPMNFSMPDPIDLTWENADGSYYLVVVENLETTLDAIRDFGGATPPGNSFRKRPTNSSGQQLSPMDFQYYGTHRVTLYHVLPDYASLYDDSSASSQNLTNPSTSISNGYGIFTGMNSESIIIEVTE